MNTVRKAVIPAAGLGTRVLPATKSIPKEMLPIVDKPAIQYIVEEAAASGITDILIITNRGKGAIEDHFDHSFELEYELKQRGKLNELETVKRLADLANVTFLRQKETKGLGHAVLMAENFVDNEPFAVLYGDDVVIGDVPATKELIDVYNDYSFGVAGVKPVELGEIGKYCSLKVEPVNERVMRVSDMVEKPRPDQIFSPYAILGRVVLPPEIFGILKNTPNGAGGELQLTDAMKTLAKTKGMMGIEYQSRRYDMGNKLSIITANIEQGLKHNEIGAGLREYIKEIAKTL